MGLGLVSGGMIIMMWRIFEVWIHRSTFHLELMCRLSDVCRYLFSPENNNQELWRPEQVIVDNSSPPLNYDDMDSAPFVWVLTGRHVKKSRTACGHVFCLKCLILRSQIKLECPTCKQSFDTTTCN